MYQPLPGIVISLNDSLRMSQIFTLIFGVRQAHAGDHLGKNHRASFGLYGGTAHHGVGVGGDTMFDGV